MSELPQEAETLLAVAPSDFVAERKRVAQAFREAGRTDDAAAVAGLRKPPAAVFAVNRAARDRPKAAQAAAEAARRVQKAQVGGDHEAFRQALAELDDALELLADVAVAHAAPSGKGASDAARRRIRDLLRSAAADDQAREALSRGALTEELEAAGFSPFAGMAIAPSRGRTTRPSDPSRAEQRETKRREREQALRDELERAEQQLRDATKVARDAERERSRALRAVESARAKLEALE